MPAKGPQSTTATKSTGHSLGVTFAIRLFVLLIFAGIVATIIVLATHNNLQLVSSSQPESSTELYFSGSPVFGTLHAGDIVKVPAIVASHQQSAATYTYTMTLQTNGKNAAPPVRGQLTVQPGTLVHLPLQFTAPAVGNYVLTIQLQPGSQVIHYKLEVSR